MKKIALIVVLLAGALVGYNYVTTGEVTLRPGRSASGVGRELADLQDRFESARRQMTGAGRAAGLAGVDTTADAAAARSEVDAVLRELGRLKGQAQGTELAEIERLEGTVREYRKTLG